MIFSKLERRWLELLALMALISVTTPIFWLTDVDYQVASLFYQPGDGINVWPWKQWWLWDYLFRYATKFAVAIVVGALLIAISSYALPKLIPWRRPAIYIVLVIALGPGLVVNVIFKDHWGRPRPVHISEFGGQYAYVPPLQIGNTPDKSFPCGHCSVAYLFFACYFLSRKRKAFYFLLTLLFALMMALTRLSAGGHFISDILWSGYLVFLVAWLVYYGWYERGSCDAK
ncbi:MAG: phosphatase PAP2 family protein [Methylovulum sp.]|nr:phosphatase PAP2 family protein [Methylovulum sp.]